MHFLAQSKQQWTNLPSRHIVLAPDCRLLHLVAGHQDSHVDHYTLHKSDPQESPRKKKGFFKQQQKHTKEINILTYNK